jgi:molybdopterin-guanine dinucleotide biosynthesis protein A
MTIAAVILAGGKSSGFGSDQLLAPFHGRPMLAQALATVRSVVPATTVSVESPEHAERLRAALHQEFPVLVDRREFQGNGPASGIASAVLALSADEILFVPADMPRLNPSALGALIELRRLSEYDVLAPWSSTGVVDSVVQVVRRSAVLPFVLALHERGAAGVRPTDFLRASERGGLVPRPVLSPAPAGFAHVNTPRDLSVVARMPPARPALRAEAIARPCVTHVPNRAVSCYYDAHSSLDERRFAEASRSFHREAFVYHRLGSPQLELHCRRDAVQARREPDRFFRPMRP